MPIHLHRLPSPGSSILVLSLIVGMTGCSMLPGQKSPQPTAAPTASPQASKKPTQATSAPKLTATDLNNRGVEKIDKADYKGALKDFNQALKLDRKSAETYLNRGIAYSSLKQSANAVKDYTQAIKLDPKSGTAYLNRADEYISLNQKQNAIADLRQAIALFKKQGNSSDVRIAQVSLDNLVSETAPVSAAIVASTANRAAPAPPAAKPPAGPSAELALALHLKSLGAKMYSAYWCSACKWQEAQFEEAKSELEIIECDPRGAGAQPDRCKAAGLQGYPTWEINGRVYPSGGLTLPELADLTNYQGPRNFRP